MATKQESRRGPRVGDAASLWNFTPSPGWSKEEVFILKLCLQKYGIGRWVQILDSGLLPGKLIQQLNGQTQRLLGQQSLAAYTGLQVDVDRVRADNEAKADVERKGGLIIWSGPNPTKQMKEDWRQEAAAKYGLTAEQLAEVEQQLQELQDLAKHTAPAAALQNSQSHLDRGAARATHTTEAEANEATAMNSKVEVLQQLHLQLQQLLGLLKQHNIALSVPQGFEGFHAQKHVRNGTLSAAAQDSYCKEVQHRADAAVLTEAQAINNSCNVMAASTMLTGLKRQTGATAPAAAQKRSRNTQRTSGNVKRARKAGKRTKLQHIESDSDAEADEKLSGYPRAAGRRGATRAGPIAIRHALQSSGLVEELSAMGFSRAKAQDALEMCEGDMQAAIGWLVTNCLG